MRIVHVVPSVFGLSGTQKPVGASVEAVQRLGLEAELDSAIQEPDLPPAGAVQHDSVCSVRLTEADL